MLAINLFYYFLNIYKVSFTKSNTWFELYWITYMNSFYSLFKFYFENNYTELFIQKVGVLMSCINEFIFIFF